MMVTLSCIAHDRWGLTARAIAAIFGGYILASLFSIAGVLLLSIADVNKAEAVLAMAMGSSLYMPPSSCRIPNALRTESMARPGDASTPPMLFSALYETAIPWTALFML